MSEQQGPQSEGREKDQISGRRDPSNKGAGKPSGPGGPGGPKPPGGPNFMSRSAFAWILLGGLAIALLLLMNSQQNTAREITWNKFYEHATEGHFEGAVAVEDTRMTGTLKEGVAGQDAAAVRTGRRVYVAVNPANLPLRTHALTEAGQDTKEEPGNGLLLMLLINWGPFFLIAFLIYFFVFRSLRNAGGGPGGMLGNFGRSRHKVLSKEHSSVTLDDVAGIREAKDEVQEIIEFLKNPKKFQRLGGRVPRGVLLVGRPGCGKTLLAKAVAGEADVPFFSISGSDFVEMFVGVGASRVRDLFKQAKDSAPCIIFLDEIDAVGRRRGSGFSSGGHDEREQTLNAILVEMDGFDSSDQVIVIASTNRADVLDPALTRPGRFDRQVHVPLPDIKGRMEILKVHSRKVKLSPDVDLERLARATPMFSGAELEAVINEAAIAATMVAKDFVEQVDLDEARDKVRHGRARKSAVIDEEEKRVVAYHEAGHAVIFYADPDAEPLDKVTIIPRGQALGVTFGLPEKDRNIYSKKRLMAMMRVCYGGRIAEQMFTGDQYNGTGGDIRQAMGLARAIVTEYGMSEKVGFRFFGDDQDRQPWEQGAAVSDETARLIDQEIKALIDQTYAEATALIEKYRTETEALAEALLKYETLTADEVALIMLGKPLGKPSVSEMLAAASAEAEAREVAPGAETGEAADVPPAE